MKQSLGIRGRTYRLTDLLIAVLILGYAIQIFSPLRVDTDATYYLSVAASHADGRGLFFYEHATKFPPGYSLIVSTLDRAGFASSGTMIGLNWLLLLVGLYAARNVIRSEFRFSEFRTSATILFTVCSFVLVKYFPMARSEIVFFGLVMAVLALFTRLRRPTGSLNGLVFGSALILTAAAISVRTVGIVLLPTFVWAIMGDNVRSFGAIVRDRTRLSIMAVVLFSGIALTWWALANTHYYDALIARYSEEMGFGKLWVVFRYKLTELGEIFLNVPSSRLPYAASPVFMVIGLAVLATLFRGAWNRRGRFSFVDIFVAVHTIILFVWPGSNARFWLPVLPFLFCYALEAFRPLFEYRTFRRLIWLYGTALVLTGIAALSYTTSITFSGDDFPSRYGDGSLTATYESALQGKPLDDDVQLRVFRVLLRYESRIPETWDPAQYQPY